jgi:FdhD protein
MAEMTTQVSSVRQPVQYRQYHQATWEVINAEVIVEAPVSLTVNGEVWLNFMCTPVDLDALAIGFLFNEGYIQTMDEVASVRICPTGDNVDVWLRRAISRPEHWTRTSGCTGGATSTTSNPVPSSFLDDGRRLSPTEIGSLVSQFLETQRLYHEMGGVHASALSDGEHICLTTEDIGRHNTLDKIAGRCLLDQMVLTTRVLLTTGRISYEMIQKARRIGAAVVISRTSPCSLSIELAERWGITLIGYARRDRFNVYTHPERVQITPTPSPV